MWCVPTLKTGFGSALITKTGKHLSKVGRDVLIKAVVQAIPTYCVSSFLIPTFLCEEIQRVINSFWQGKNCGTGRGINWMSWDRLSARKENGGMNFKLIQFSYVGEAKLEIRF